MVEFNKLERVQSVNYEIPYHLESFFDSVRHNWGPQQEFFVVNHHKI